jgi:RNA polymerase sigma-70 factor (ECF subfamily)
MRQHLRDFVRPTGKAVAKARILGGERVSEPDDLRLLRDLRARRPDACAELVRRHYQAVYRFLVHLTRDVHWAEDLAQETFAAAWEKLAAFEGRASLATWLHRIAYTKFIDSRRSKQRTAVLLENRPLAPVASADPSETVMADDEARNLYRLLNGLDDSDRTLLVLHYLQGLSYREMAAVLDAPAGTVKWRVSEALNQLRTLLSDEVSDHAPRTTSDA